MTTRAFKEIVLQNKPLLLPVAHDALTAKLIENAGFSAYQVGGFALSASKLAVPDIGLLTFGETYPAVADIMKASTLPLIIDCDTGGNGPKDVVRMVETYESMGVAGLFLKTRPTQTCGHMSAANLISRENYVSKLEAALSARKSNDFFIMARTDSYKSEGINGVQERGESYLSAGADALFIDGLQTMEDITAIGEIFKGDEIHLSYNCFRGRATKSKLNPMTFINEGFRIVLYPTSILFRVVENHQRYPRKNVRL
jgi:2-methylisocitrate lyase-like PEP mutase family enzyme